MRLPALHPQGFSPLPSSAGHTAREDARAVAVPASSEDPPLLYSAGRQSMKVRFLMWFALACAGAAVWEGYDLLLTYGTLPPDGGVLAPLPTRLAWAASVSLIGLSFAYGMWLYGRYAVREIRLVPGDQTFRIATYRFIGSRVETVAIGEVVVATKRHDRIKTGDFLALVSGLTVDAPWLSVRLRGRRWPLVLDLQGVVANNARLAALLKTRNPD